MSDRHNQFTRRIRISKDVQSVFEAWAVQGGMEKWMLQSANFIRKNEVIPPGSIIQRGDECEWVWHGWPDHTHTGVVTKVERNKIFSFTFDPAGIVDVHFKTIGNQGTEVILNQSEVPVEGADWYQYFYGCSLGWSFWLVNLKAWLEYGITLDEREIQYDGDEKYQVINQ